MSKLDESLATKRDQLLATLKGYGSCAVAYSGGVDSAVVAKAAQLALGNAAVAITGISASLAPSEMEAARRLAKLIGVRHVEVATDEFANPLYVANAPDRCFHCKTELYERLGPIARQLGLATIANGANVDDLGDYRPGMQAARDYDVRSPLADCGFSKSDVRRLAAVWELPVAEKPAAPCLSSRVAYGQEVTPERLQRIDRAEQALRRMGLVNLRVRFHGGDLARIEIPQNELARLCQPETRERLVAELRELGFKFVTLDLEGFRSGSLNDLIPLKNLRPST